MVITVVVLIILGIVLLFKYTSNLTEKFGCYGLDERDCNNTVGCGWCIDPNHDGKCVSGTSAGPTVGAICSSWSSSTPAVPVTVVPAMVPVYYPSYWTRYRT